MVKSQKNRLLPTLLLVSLLASLCCPGCGSPAPSSEPAPSTPHSVFVPGVSEGRANATPTPTTGAPAQSPGAATPLPPPVSKPDYGVQFHVPPGGDLEQTLRWAEGLGVGWVKHQVQWHTIEHGPEDFEWHNLDRLVAGVDSFGFELLLSVTHAPDWTRAAELESGPPADYTQFGRFMEQLARRYRGRVEAYELWNEPNLAREWRGDTLDPARFVALVAEGAAGVRAADPQALIVSGAPAVTGIDDGETAINDRVFLRGMYEAGIVQHVDAIGAHPYGYANPPEESVHDERHAASSHNDHPTFFFRDTLEDYHQIMLDYNDDQSQIWVTEFGWPSPEGIGEMDLTGWEYGREVSGAEQADYVVRAFHMGDERPWVGPMFLWNLNLATIWGAQSAYSAYSLLRPDGSYRPSYVALRLAGPIEP
jgi:hypothetical protein